MADLVDAYRRGSDWTIEKVGGAAGRLDDPTPCDKWTVRQLLDHMLDTQQYFVAKVRGGEPTPPNPDPPAVISEDPSADFRKEQAALLDVYATKEPDQSLGIAFADLVMHGIDLARATGQDDTLPDGLAEVAFGLLDGQIGDAARPVMFGAEITVPDDASAQEKLLAYSGRQPTA